MIMKISIPNKFRFKKVSGLKNLLMYNKAGNDVHYIGGTDILPPPLSPAKEKEALLRLENNDETAKALLIEHNLRLVVYITKKFEVDVAGMEDLISIGTIGLIKAINSFKADKNIKLATYASRCIENEILMYLRHTQKTRYEISIDEPLNVDWDGNELLLSDILGTNEDIISKNIEDEATRSVLDKAIKKLTSREKTIIDMRFGMGECTQEMTQKEVADALNISQSYISRLEKKIIKKLRREIMRYENC